MSRTRQQVFDCIDRLNLCTTSDDVVAELASTGSRFGYDNFCISGLPMPHERLDPYVLLSGWPEEWMSRYAREDFVHTDPVIRMVRKTTMPFTWSEAPYDPQDKPAARVMNEATEFGLREGLAVPIFTTHGFQAIVTFGADKLQLNRDEKAGLHLVAIYAHARARSLLRHDDTRDRRPTPRLTPRELDCLRWTSAGKTAWEISEIMGLSQRTIEAYLNSAMMKLSSVNRVQAVAEALRQNIIQ